jgi:ABC-type transport system involved in multi-copper enzyme maturation permease subunit
MGASNAAPFVSHLQRQSTHHPHPLLSVMTWELRRFRANRLFLIQALSLFCIFVLVTWIEATVQQFPVDYSAGVPTGAIAFVPGTSAWGLLENLPNTLLLLVVLVPFVTVDGVARDRQRRTHELLMSTAAPSWAYVWGRYLIGLLMSLGLALALLAAILGVGTIQRLITPGYPAPGLGVVLALWGGMVVPATVLVSSVGFALVTLFPRLSAPVKIVILVAWVIGTLVLAPLINQWTPARSTLPTKYGAWDPTSAVTASTLLQHYGVAFGPQDPVPATSAQFQSLVNSIANKAPDVSAWFAPHLIEAALSLVLVAVTALAFRRFRNAVKG